MAELYGYKRYEKSLGLLTTRFVSLLQAANNGVLDLKIVSIYLLFVTLIAVSLRLKKKNNLNFVKYDFFSLGDGFISSKTKAKDIRHNKCFRGHRLNREKK